MREVINEIDRVDDEENDFIYTNKIKISDFVVLGEKKKIEDYDYQPMKLDENGDYTEFIMNVINSVVKVTQESRED